MDMTGLIIDFYDDSFASVLVDDVDGMEKVGSVEPATSEKLDKLGDHEFALILCDGAEKFRKFACHEPGHVKLSSHYYSKNKQKLHPMAQKTAAFFIKRAYNRFDMEIPEFIEKDASGFRATTNVVSVRDAYTHPVEHFPKPDLGSMDDSEFAFIRKEGSYKVRKYPMRKKAHVAASIRYFVDHQIDHRPGERVKIARSLLNAARNTSVDGADKDMAASICELKKIAENSFSPDLYSWMLARKGLVDSKESRDTLSELYEKRAEFGDETFVSLLAKFDEMEGLDRFYDKGLPNPENSTLGIEKKAEQIEYMEGTRKIGHDLIKSVDRKIVDAVFGPQIGEKWASDPVAAFTSLSDAAKDLIVENIIRNM